MKIGSFNKSGQDIQRAHTNTKVWQIISRFVSNSSTQINQATKTSLTIYLVNRRHISKQWQHLPISV